MKLTYDEDSRMWVSEVVQVEIARAPFDRGIMHIVYKCLETVAGEAEKITRVAKFLDSKSLGMKITKQMYFDEAGAHLVSKRFAIQFNRKSPQPINFCDIHLLELIERPGKPMCRIEVHASLTLKIVGLINCFLEKPLMTGVWVKHNNNNGAVLSIRMTPQAFSHFTFEESQVIFWFCLFADLMWCQGFLTVCDIQGCSNTFTDPQVLNAKCKVDLLGRQTKYNIFISEIKWQGSQRVFADPLQGRAGIRFGEHWRGRPSQVSHVPHMQHRVCCSGPTTAV